MTMASPAWGEDFTTEAFDAALLAGQRPRESERAYHCVIKSRDRGYPITADGDNEQTEGVPELAA